MKKLNLKNKPVAVVCALALATGMLGACAANHDVPELDYPGIMTAPKADTVHEAGVAAQEAKAAAELAAQREAAKAAAEAAKAEADEKALEGGEIVEDENAPEGTVAVKDTDGNVRYVPAEKAEKSVESGATKPAPKKDNGSSGNSGSNSGNSGSSNSGSGNSGSNGSSNTSKPAPEPEKPVEHVHNWVTETWSDPDTVEKVSVSKCFCTYCGWSVDNEYYDTCPNCGEFTASGKKVETIVTPGKTHTKTVCNECGATK